jgi:hypothetical protein
MSGITRDVQLAVPPRWEDVTPAWMTAALAPDHPGARVERVELVLRDDGTNRRARFALSYAEGTGPATVFVKAESDVHGRREVHARNGNLFNEARLFGCGAPLPVEHPRAYCAVVDEPNLDYVIVMEDLVARGADPRDATRPLSVEQVARGVRGIARLHSRYWGRVDDEPALRWVQPFLPTEGWLAPMRKGVVKGLERAHDVLPDAVRRLDGADLAGRVWAASIAALTTGPQTLLHGDPHIGNTYVVPDGEVGFLDWQVVRRGSWAHDVGYFVQGALTETDRRACEADLVEEYRRALDVPAGERPPAEEAWLRYRASSAHGLTVWLVTLLSDVHATERSLALVQRYAAAFAELDTPAAIEGINA